MSETVKKSSLQSRLSLNIPDLPNFNPNWTMKQYEDVQVEWKRKLIDYLRRKDAQLTGPNIYNELIEQVENFFLIMNPGGGGSGTTGMGPVALDVYADSTWEDADSEFNGTLVGTAKTSTVYLDHLEYTFFIGDNLGPPFQLKYRAVRLRGKIVIPTAEDWNFRLVHDDGARLYMDEVLVIDEWGGSGDDQVTDDGADPLTFTAGQIVPFVLEVINSAGSNLAAKLSWLAPTATGDVWQNIPYSALRAP